MDDWQTLQTALDLLRAARTAVDDVQRQAQAIAENVARMQAAQDACAKRQDERYAELRQELDDRLASLNDRLTGTARQRATLTVLAVLVAVELAAAIVAGAAPRIIELVRLALLRIP